MSDNWENVLTPKQKRERDKLQRETAAHVAAERVRLAEETRIAEEKAARNAVEKARRNIIEAEQARQREAQRLFEEQRREQQRAEEEEEMRKEILYTKYNPKNSTYKYAKEMLTYAKFQASNHLNNLEKGWVDKYVMSKNTLTNTKNEYRKIYQNATGHQYMYDESDIYYIEHKLKEAEAIYNALKMQYETTTLYFWDELIRLAEKNELPNEVKQFLGRPKNENEPEGAAAAPAPAAVPGPITYYNILGVNRNANMNSIKKAYRKLALERHPNKGGTDAQFQELQGAYEILSNNAKRANYNRTHHGGRKARKLTRRRRRD